MNTEEMLVKIQSNELYQKSKALHKELQLCKINGPDGLLQGQILRQEDYKGRLPGDDGFDPANLMTVIYNFKDGILTDDGDTAAVQAGTHWEHWTEGLITSVFAEGGRVLETWKNGVPVEIKIEE